MAFYLPIFVAVFAVFAAMTHAQQKCCAPDKLSGVAIFEGKTQFSVSVDWTINKVYEDWGGNRGVAGVLVDRNAKMVYTRRTDGTCKKIPETQSYYTQCVDDWAAHIKVQTENDVALDGWLYNTKPGVSRLIVVKREGCLPYRMHQVQNDKFRVAHFIDIVESIPDPSVFDTDVSDCVDG